MAHSGELIAFMVERTGWALEYIMSIPIKRLRALARELLFRKQVDDYKRMHDLAGIFALWASSQKKGRTYRATDFIGDMPERGKENMVDEIAKKSEPTFITLNDGKEYEMAQLNLNIMCDIEDKFDAPFTKLFSEARAKVFRYLLVLLLKDKHPDMDENHIGVLVTPRVMGDMATKIAKQIGA